MTRGAIASGCPFSAAAGADVLAAGGNAVDAVVAASFMASFSLPTMTGLGGGGVLTLQMDGAQHALDFFATLPGLGFSGTRREPEVIVVPFEGVRLPFKVGRPTMAVPGMVAGLFALHERFGRIPLAELVQPAQQAARDGVEVTEGQHRAFALLEPIFRRTPEAWALIGLEDRVVTEGDRLANPAFADFVGALVEEGPSGFYTGDVAARIEAVSDGFVTTQDLAAYEPRWSRPLTRNYRRFTVHSPRAPSLNGALLQYALAHLEQAGPLPTFGGADYFRRIAEALQATEALRTPDYEASLFEDGYLDGVLATCPGGNTMQCSVVDAEGNAVSMTSTVGEGAGFVIPGSGVILNNFLGEEDILPDHVEQVPGRRMMTSMAPTLVENEAGDILAVGAAGSARIRSAIFQVLVHALDGGCALEDAVAMPRIHPEGDTIFIEAYGRTPEEVASLEPLGREAVMTYEIGFFFGGVQTARRVGGVFDAGAETVRRGCVARVV